MGPGGRLPPAHCPGLIVPAAGALSQSGRQQVVKRSSAGTLRRLLVIGQKPLAISRHLARGFPKFVGHRRGALPCPCVWKALPLWRGSLCRRLAHAPSLPALLLHHLSQDRRWRGLRHQPDGCCPFARGDRPGLAGDHTMPRSRRWTTTASAVSRPDPAQRHFCRHCASALWLFDPRWPDLVHPFASAIDSALPVPPNRVHLMLRYKPAWVVPEVGPDDLCFEEFPEQSIEDSAPQPGALDHVMLSRERRVRSGPTLFWLASWNLTRQARRVSPGQYRRNLLHQLGSDGRAWLTIRCRRRP